MQLAELVELVASLLHLALQAAREQRDREEGGGVDAEGRRRLVERRRRHAREGRQPAAARAQRHHAVGEDRAAGDPRARARPRADRRAHDPDDVQEPQERSRAARRVDQAGDQDAVRDQLAAEQPARAAPVGLHDAEGQRQQEPHQHQRVEHVELLLRDRAGLAVHDQHRQPEHHGDRDQPRGERVDRSPARSAAAPHGSR